MSVKTTLGIYRAKAEYSLDKIEPYLIASDHTRQNTTATYPGWDYSVFYKKGTSKVKWKKFLAPVLDPACDALKSEYQSNERLVVCLQNDTKTVTYIAAFGAGYFSIAELVDPDFGISILSKIVKKDQDILKSTKEANLSGGIFGEIKFFRNNYSLNENESFGSFYQEVQAIIEKQILIDHLGFDADDIKKDNICIAKNSFKVAKTIDFTQLIGILNGFEWIEANLKPIEINNVRKLHPIIDRELIKALKVKLLTSLYRRYLRRQNSYQFDLCHKDFDKYLTAGSYEVSNAPFGFLSSGIQELNNFDQLVLIVQSIDGLISDIHAFFERYKTLVIQSFGDDSSLLTKGGVIPHVIADLQMRSMRYFLIDENWYHINQTYIDRLNSDCNSFIDKSYHRIAILPWGASIKDENAYNFTYLNNPQTIVLDKVLHENIELCDILRWDADNLYLYHVKQSVGNTMRDLCSQIVIAAQRLKRDQNTGYNFVKSVYESLKSKIGGDKYFDAIGNQTNAITESDFMELFKKKIIFVLVVKDVSSKARTIRSMEKYNSNIAKLSISELYRKMKSIDIPLEIIQTT